MPQPRPSPAVLLAALLGAGAAAAQEPETYDLREEAAPAVGDRLRFSLREHQRVATTLRTGGEDLEEQVEEAGLEEVYVEEVAAVADGRATRLVRTYERFVDLGSGEEHDVAGLEVTIARDEASGGYAYEVAGEALLPARLEARLAGEVAALSALGEDEDGEDDSLAAFLPAEPVAVGERWAVDLEGLVADLDLDPADVDLEASRAEASLQAVRAVDGREERVLAFTSRLELGSVEGVPCPEPFVVELTGDGFRCPADPTRELATEGTVEGVAAMPQQPGVTVVYRMTMEQRESVRRVE